MFGSYSIENRRKGKMKSEDRIIHLKVKDGMSPKSVTGLVDNRLFKEEGGNRLHGFFDSQRGAWRCKYDVGAIPSGIEGSWSTFAELLASVTTYFDKRNITVDRVEE